MAKEGEEWQAAPGVFEQEPQQGQAEQGGEVEPEAEYEADEADEAGFSARAPRHRKQESNNVWRHAENPQSTKHRTKHNNRKLNRNHAEHRTEKNDEEEDEEDSA